MKKYLPIILPLAGFKFLIHWVGNQNYGFHRDELLHLSVSEHLAWGYMEFPPFIAWISKISYLLFDYSVVGVRLFPTLAGLAILLLCCLMAKDLGGKKGAVLLAGICVLAFLPFYRNHTLFQPVAFDQLFWTLGFFFLVKYIKKPNYIFLICLGASLGLGMLNKYTMSIWAIGLLVGLFFYEKGKLYKDKWLYISLGLAFLLVLPNLIWQLQHDIPFLKQLASLEAKQLDEIHPLEFGRAQLSIPSTFIISLIGIYALLFGEKLKQYRTVGVMVLVIFSTMWIMKAKAYYVFGIYPVLFAAGAVKVEAFLSKRPIWVYVIAFILPLPYLYFIPQLTPILPIETYVSYKGLEEVDGRVEL
ncbi:MAG: glycosyltransferase family 39 protein, partial [Bacteroidota bacterium]